MGAFSDRVFAVLNKFLAARLPRMDKLLALLALPVLRVMSVMPCAQTLLLEQILRQSLATASYSKMGAWQPDLLLEVLVFSKQCYKKKVSNLTMRIKLS